MTGVLLECVSAPVFPLVLCTGLNASQRQLRALELSAHEFPGALLETECVCVDACTQQNHRGQAVPLGAWLWRNASALRLDGNDTLVRGAELASAYNWQQHYALSWIACSAGYAAPASATPK
jgi:hypothetical protein